ncbi:MAG: methylenetetrahydrofolate reductase [NAD(P)H] [Myxococcota bacterium]
MRIRDLYEQNQPIFSFEFFPPHTPKGARSLMRTVQELRKLDPGFVSVTYPLDAKRRQLTLELVAKIKSETGIEAMAHLTCVSSTEREMRRVLESLESADIHNVLALRGDYPEGEDQPDAEDAFAHGSDLAAFIRDNFSFCVGGAAHTEGHPESPDLEHDLKNTLLKVRAGCEFLITQLFFVNADYFSAVERARELGIDVPIVPGIMPVTSVKGIRRMSQLSGATMPEDLLSDLERVEDDDGAAARIGVAYAREQCRELLEHGIPGIHFYTLNRSAATREIVLSLPR